MADDIDVTRSLIDQRATDDIDVLVLGAGIAGLAAAAALREHGLSVLLVEGRDRIGGRIHSVQLQSGSTIDLGASWIHGNSSSNPVAVIAAAEGLQLVATDARENSLHARTGQLLATSVKQQHELLFQKFESYLEQLQDDSSTCKQLSVADAQKAFVQQQGLSTEQQHGLDFMINTRIEQEYGADAADLSALWFDADEPCDGDDVLFPAGYSQVVQAVARWLDDVIRLQHNVTRICYSDSSSCSGCSKQSCSCACCCGQEGCDCSRQGSNPARAGCSSRHSTCRNAASSPTAGTSSTTHCCCSSSSSSSSSGVTVHAETPSGSVAFTARHAIVTFPIGVLKAQHSRLFEPPLPAAKQAAIANLGVGLLDKVFLFYQHPFWERAGTAWINRMPQQGVPGGGRWQEWFSASKSLPQLPALVAFNCGSPAWQAERDSDEQLTQQVTDVLVSMFPQAAAAAKSPTQVIVTRWGTDPFSLGSYAMMPPGSSPADMAALAAPVSDVLFFAGEAMSAANQGTVHGAYATGQDAAQAVLQAHKQRQQQQQQQQQEAQLESAALPLQVA